MKRSLKNGTLAMAFVLTFLVLFEAKSTGATLSSEHQLFLDGQPFEQVSTHEILVNSYGTIMVHASDLLREMNYRIIPLSLNKVFYYETGHFMPIINGKVFKLHTPIMVNDNDLYLSLYDASNITQSSITRISSSKFLLTSAEKAAFDDSVRSILAPNTDDTENYFLGPIDSANPLAIWRQPISNNLLRLADLVLKGHENDSDHEKVLVFIKFMQDFVVGYPQTTMVDSVIIEKKGSCGEFTNILLALAATQNIEGRVINLHNYPDGYGHTVAELFIDNHWCLYDPTYGIYYYTVDTNGEHHILSFNDLQNGMGFDPRVQRAVLCPMRISDYSAGYIDPMIFIMSNPSGPIGTDKPMIYPLSLDMTGNHDLNMQDYSSDQGVLQGVSYIGTEGMCILQLWTFNNLVTGQEYAFTITPAGFGGENLIEKPFFTANATAEVQSSDIINGFQINMDINNPQPWIIKFRAKDVTCTRFVGHTGVR